MRLRLTIMAGLATLLASVGLYPLFESGGWFFTGVGAIVVAGTAGVLSRRIRVTAWLCAPVGLAALFLYLTVVFAHDHALIGVIPTPSSTARLGRLVGEGWHDANAYAAPVPMLPAIDLLTGTGIGLVAVLVDFLAVRMRRAALAGLPLLAVYSVPAAVRQETVSWLAFLLGAAGYLGLLVVDAREQLAGWGRAVFTRHWSPARYDERPDSSPLAAAGRRIGLTAVAVAIVLPFAVPGIEPRGLLGFGGGGGGETEGGSGAIAGVYALNPLVSVRRQLVRGGDAEVLKYRTTDGTAPEYLRMYSLDRFDGETWTTAPLRGDKDSPRIDDKGLPVDPAMGAVPARTVTTSINVNSQVHGLDVLPMPYPPVKVDIKGDWRVDPRSLTVFSSHDSAGGRSYTVTSLRPEPTYQELVTNAPPPATITARDLGVPGSVGDDITELATEATEGAATPYDKAVKLQEYFTQPGRFTYSLDAPPLSRRSGALRDFLFTSHTGYCEQFAASMALLARLLGIPARVGMGYTAGSQAPDGSWVVRTKDAHAWPELYFAGVGWLRFEPTPAGDGGQGSASVPSYTAPLSLPGAPGSTSQDQLPPGTTLPNGDPTAGAGAVPRHRTDPLTDQREAPGVVSDQHGSHLPITWLLVALVVVLLLLTPVSVRRLAWARRWSRAKSDAAVAHAAWDELRADAIDHRLEWPASETPRSTARRLTEALALDETATAALTRLSRAEERARYAPSAEATTTLRNDAQVLHSAFSARAGRWVRWRARLFPPSATATLRRAGGRALDVFEWLDVATLRRRRHT
jgi:transglutaminase-like putative cysteine protease